MQGGGVFGVRFAVMLVVAALLALSYGLDLDAWLKKPAPQPAPKAEKTLAAPVNRLKIEEPETADIWTATRSLSAQENALAHFKKHGRDFKFSQPEDYIAAASEFLHAPPEGTQTKVQGDGDIVRFHAPSRRFAVMRADGTPRTYYILKPEIHGYPTNQAYFDAQ